MIDAKLSGFVATILRSKRIRFGDVRRLARDVLPRGIADRSTAEALLALDRVVDRTDPAWIDYLAGAIRDFVLAGTIDESSWLEASLGARPTKAGKAIERELALGRELSRPGGMATPDEPHRTAMASAEAAA